MKEDKKIAETPLMKQYFSVKAQHPDALLLFRVGDFYETFGEDAITASKVLGIVLTKRGNGAATSVALAGFPHHSIETYLPKLVRSGYKVAVCDQLEDPKLTKKIVKRGVTELVTPGIAYSEQLLEQKENNFLCAVSFRKDKGGVAFLDVSTGTFKVAEGSLEYIEVLLSNFAPKEIVIERGYMNGFKERFGTGYYLSPMDEWAYVYDACNDKLKKQFGLQSLKGFGIETLPLGITAAGAILFYLEQNHSTGASHLCSISRVDEGNYVWLDRFTFRNLEIFSPASCAEGTSLIDVVDKCSSPLGARLLRNWLSMPVKSKEEIEKRHSVVEFFVNEREAAEHVRECISNVGDLERITARAAAGKISPREVVQLKRGLDQMAPIKAVCSESSQVSGGADELLRIGEGISLFEELKQEISSTMLQEPASQFGKGDIIAEGVNDELDNLRKIARYGKDYLLQIQQRESERTGIPSLKISYNNVFGYYLEVRNTHKDKVPEDWIRKQTLVNAERYITQELKEYEEKILGAQDRIYVLEQQIFQELVASIQASIYKIQQSSAAVARIDCLAGFAQLAIENRYCRPVMTDGFELEISQGRHPVIETLMAPGEEYVANDLYLDNDTQQIIILTGPNMAGKSALLRQTALIVLLAQVGSFVPAKSARIGIVDKIFTRVGASDNISRGESTFMVEMIESSTILHNLSERSLVLLDEIGRGTSTFDGMSIAWAIVEYIHQGKYRAKTLFATHYHELNELETIYNRVRNYHISVKEADGKVLFLRKLCEGGVAHSFGIHVARLAGMPQSVIESAQRKLRRLESTRDAAGDFSGDGGNLADKERVPEKGKKAKKSALQDSLQLSFYQLDDPLLVDIKEKLKAMDINTMSPLDAFDALRALKKQIGCN
ncbi:MAG: DNA mismatch repair protein MutS [Bacteroidales bacterium]|nr:DNA mismatch repair protein MutS [Bacteroidales bacterium]